MDGIKKRLAALAAALRDRARRETPYEDLDPISQSLADVANELKALDEQGKAALLEEMNRDGANMDAAGLERMIRSITVSY